MTCIYDNFDQCTHDCEGCSAYKLRCELCGCEAEEVRLYEVCGDVLCLDCLISEQGSELYTDFASELEEEFRSFCSEHWQSCLIPSQSSLWDSFSADF